jgi:hypothetical protein
VLLGGGEQFDFNRGLHIDTLYHSGRLVKGFLGSQFLPRLKPWASLRRIA